MGQARPISEVEELMMILNGQQPFCELAEHFRKPAPAGGLAGGNAAYRPHFY